VQNEGALAHEVAARVLRRGGAGASIRFAHTYLREARRCYYLRWGASGKVAAARTAYYPHLRDGTSRCISHHYHRRRPVEQLDVGTVVKASQGGCPVKNPPR